MSNYDNTNKGTLGKNKRKEQDTHPDYSGQINIEGREFWLSAWLKENGQTGEKFFSLAVKPKDQQQRQAPPPQQRQATSYTRPQSQSKQQQPIKHGYGKTPPPDNYEQLDDAASHSSDIQF